VAKVSVLHFDFSFNQPIQLFRYQVESFNHRYQDEQLFLEFYLFLFYQCLFELIYLSLPFSDAQVTFVNDVLVVTDQ